MYLSRLFGSYINHTSANTNCLKFHTSVLSLASSVAKSDLAALRKKTGYSLSICKKALSESNNNLAEAEVWLKEQAQAQGWAKAQKLQGRNTSQGLLGLRLADRKAAIVELNCETDFVARNEKFKSILDSLAKTCLTITNEGGESVNTTNISSEQVAKLNTDGSSLADLVALNIGQIGENMTIGDTTLIQASSEVNLEGRSHPSAEYDQNQLLSGRYVTVLAYTKSNDAVSLPDHLEEDKLPGLLCQHIIGMNPTVIVNEEEKDKSLLHQSFLADESFTVEEICSKAGIKIVHFIRREIGRQ